MTSISTGTQRLSGLAIPHHPMIAALQFGLRLNELAHRQEVAWFTACGEDISRIAELYGELRQLILGLTQDEMRRQSIREAINESESDWNGAFRNEDQDERFVQLEWDLAATLHGNGGGETVRELLDEMRTTMPVFASRCRRALAENLSETLNTAVGLGRELDLAIRPLNPHTRMTIDTEPFTGVANWDSGSGEGENSPPEIRLTSADGNRVVYREWLSIVQHRWQELGLSESAFPQLEDEGPAAELVEQIESAFREQFAQFPSARPAPGSGYLGLTLTGSHLSREGYAAIEITSRLRLSILHCLIQARGSYTERSELARRWEEFGGNDPDPVDSTVRGEISRLRSEVEQLSVVIASPRNIGVRLQCSEDSDAAASS